MLLSMSVTAFAAYKTKVIYEGAETEHYTVTVPGQLAPGGSSDVFVEGSWPSNRHLIVTSDKTVTLTNDLLSSDKKPLGITFNGIDKYGNVEKQILKTDAGCTEEVSVADISNALFGEWTGTFNYYVSMFDTSVTDAPKYFTPTSATETAKIDSDGKLTEDIQLGDISSSDIQFDLSAGTKTVLGAGTKNLIIKVTYLNDTGSTALTESDIVIEDGSTIRAYKVDIVDEDGNVVIAEDNDIPIKVQFYTDKDFFDYKFYHQGIEMIESDSCEANNYTYDEATGLITMYVCHFSFFDIVHAPIPNYLCVTSIKRPEYGDKGSNIGWKVNGTLTNTPNLQYSIDSNHDWQDYTLGDTVWIEIGQKCYWRGTTTTFSESSANYITFTSSSWVELSGEVDSIINWAPLTPYCYYFMFNEGDVRTAPELPATNLAEGCYEYMFRYAGFTIAPTLPATELAKRCYSHMFDGCKSLTQPPELPATELADICYSGMFWDCTSLTEAPELPATEATRYCYQSMFRGCKKLTEAPELPATTLDDNCYEGMFNGCILITEAPVLPATTLALSCYSGMFGGCTSLTKAPTLPATTVKSGCYSSMFSGCTSLTKAPSLPATNGERSCCYYSMFSGCTSLTEAPALPMTTVDGQSYMSMFKNCTSLTKAPELPATRLGNECYSQMFSGCTSLTRLPELPATVLYNNCYSNMFAGCTGIKLSTIQDDTYKTPYRIPKEGIGTLSKYASSVLPNMFGDTGGTFTGTPDLNTTYYGAWEKSKIVF